MTPDNTEANANLAARVTELEIENRHLRSYGSASLRDPAEAIQYAQRIARGLYIAAAAAQRNGHNGLAAMISAHGDALSYDATRNPLVSTPDVDPTFSKHSPALGNVAKQHHLLSALA